MITLHPLKVQYPYGGKHFVMQWRTRSDGSHVVVAKSLRALEHVAKVIIKKYALIRDFTIQKVLEVNMVSPPGALCLNAVRLQRTLDEEEFLRNALIDVHYAILEEGHQLPEPFVYCACPQVSEYGYCNECDGLKVLSTMTATEFYGQYHAAWELANPKPSQNWDHSMYSWAPEADPSKPLWAAGMDFGHHHNGIDLVEVQEGSTWNEKALFYYQDPHDLPALQEQWEQQLKELREHQEAWDKKKQEARSAKTKDSETKRSQELIEFFKKNEPKVQRKEST